MKRERWNGYVYFGYNKRIPYTDVVVILTSEAGIQNGFVTVDKKSGIKSVIIDKSIGMIPTNMRAETIAKRYHQRQDIFTEKAEKH